MLDNLDHAVERAIDALKNIDSSTLTAERFIGRMMIPTTQLGLLFHAAEHAQRHYGQLLVTIKTVRGLFQQGSIH
ncbi:hypothetical protein [Sphingobacterium sp. BN32]